MFTYRQWVCLPTCTPPKHRRAHTDTRVHRRNAWEGPCAPTWLRAVCKIHAWIMHHASSLLMAPLCAVEGSRSAKTTLCLFKKQEEEMYSNITCSITPPPSHEQKPTRTCHRPTVSPSGLNLWECQAVRNIVGGGLVLEVEGGGMWGAAWIEKDERGRNVQRHCGEEGGWETFGRGGGNENRLKINHQKLCFKKTKIITEKSCADRKSSCSPMHLPSNNLCWAANPHPVPSRIVSQIVSRLTVHPVLLHSFVTNPVVYG